MTQPNQPAVRVRQSILNLTAIEMGHYVQAVKTLKSTDAPGGDPSIPAAAVTVKISVYDFYVQLHVQAMEHAVHKSPWFLPWHRQYILNFENALRLVGGYPASLGLPYWDWAGDPPNAREKKSKVWAGIFMGGDGELPSGPDLAGDVVADVNTASPFARGRWALTVFEYPPPAHRRGPPRGQTISGGEWAGILSRRTFLLSLTWTACWPGRRTTRLRGTGQARTRRASAMRWRAGSRQPVLRPPCPPGCTIARMCGWAGRWSRRRRRTIPSSSSTTPTSTASGRGGRIPTRA